MEDALLFGSMLMTLIRNCDRVKMACLAQLVNVAAPIMTLDGGPTWAQTIYYPFVHASRYGKGTALLTKVNCETYMTAHSGRVPFIDAAVVLSEDRNSLTIFAVNRSGETAELDVSLRDFEGFHFSRHLILEHEDLDAVNTVEEPERVVPHGGGQASVHDGMAAARLGGYSWNVIRFCKGKSKMSTVRFGANYIPSKNWLHSWINWDASSVEEDLTAARELGVDPIKAHLMWSYFRCQGNQHGGNPPAGGVPWYLRKGWHGFLHHGV